MSWRFLYAWTKLEHLFSNLISLSIDSCVSWRKITRTSFEVNLGNVISGSLLLLSEKKVETLSHCSLTRLESLTEQVRCLDRRRCNEAHDHLNFFSMTLFYLSVSERRIVCPTVPGVDGDHSTVRLHR